MKVLILALTMLAIAGCESEQEKIQAKQIDTCKENIRAGQEPTEFCLSLLPEYRAMMPQQVAPAQMQPAAYQEHQPSQAPAAPQVVYQQAPQPQVIQQAPAHDNGMTDMLVGGLIGHAIGSSSGNNSQPAPSYYHPPAPRPTYVTKNVTVINKSAPTKSATPAPMPSPAPKKNYMDTSKLSSYGARPSAPSKSSSMNMSRLSSYGKR